MEESLPTTIYQDLKDQIPTLVEALKTGAEYGGGLAHRFIMYDIWVNVIPVIVTLVATLTAGLFYGKVHRWAKEGLKTCSSYERDNYIIPNILFILMLVGMTIATAVFATNCAFVIAKDLYIPEVRIVEVLNDLLTTTAR